VLLTARRTSGYPSGYPVRGRRESRKLEAYFAMDSVRDALTQRHRGKKTIGIDRDVAGQPTQA